MTILCYHAVQPGWTAPMSMEPAAFAAHMAWLARRRTVVGLRRAMAEAGPAGTLPRGQVALTFDDGFASVHEHALPVLQRHRLPATVFLVARTLIEADPVVDWVDHPPREPLRTLTVEQVRELQAQGIEFESHSRGHLDLTRLSFEDCVADLRESREVLESVLGHPVRMLAYPRGRHSADVRKAAERAGYTHAFSLPERHEEVGPYAIPRVGIYHDNSVRHLALKTTRPYLALKTSPAVHAVRGSVTSAAARVAGALRNRRS
jgi:peptidoglycan/xylan/chitin deacetylase (PgdA/CDA1 family)